MTLRRQFSVIWDAKWLLALVTVIAGGFTLYVSNGLPRVYDATATALVGQSLTSVGIDINSLLASQRLSQTYASVATTGPLLNRVIAKENLSMSADDLRTHISAQAPLNSTLLMITVEDRDPDRAAQIANDVADELAAASAAIEGRSDNVQNFIDSEFVSTQQDIVSVRNEIKQLSALASPGPADLARLQSLQGELASLGATYSNLLNFSSRTSANGLTVIDPAVAPSSASGPRVLLNTALGTMAGFLLVLALVFVRDYLDDTVKRPDEIEVAIGAPPLGVIGEIKVGGKRSKLRLATIDEPRSPAAEAYRTLRTNLEFSQLDAPLRRILVTSALSGEGKTTTAANLAISFAQSGRRTLLVDGDLRKPAVHRLFELSNAEGLTTILRSEQTPLSHVIRSTDIQNLSVLTSGPLPPNPAEVLRSNRMQQLMQRLDQTCDLVVLDSPPIVGLADGIILSTMVDGTLLVIRAGKTRRGALRHAHEALSQVDATLLGVAINRASPRSFGSYYYEDVYTGYGAPRNGADRAEDARATTDAIPGVSQER